ncbi:toll/interleukin-1 receptor domain-containing protein [Nodosilinea sp. LEGE 07298]|uniref:TIR domain-containing protein n=1 Tax=Nodosilinea sp. LEGE 07298 TaxID=2777970 RepID=UPI00188282B7|nr:TIR domain-containing protein [Nodosilinea sp. LEGE 07298]MBE9109419.1 toll/interleukin-1 receptor domain-containing protein [Nodosilinea sp. LEGE 07298]
MSPIFLKNQYPLELYGTPVLTEIIRSMIDRNAIFISYRRSDSEDITGRIYDHLVIHYGRDSVFKDVNSIPYGIDFRSHIRHWIDLCQVVIAIIGPTWLSVADSEGNRRLEDPNDWVRLEIEIALEKQIPLIPLLVNNANLMGVKDLPHALQSLPFLNGAKVRSDPDFHNDILRLIESINRFLDPSSKEEVAVSVSGKIDESIKTPFSLIKIAELKGRLSNLTSDYQALSEQFNYVVNALEKSNIKRQMKFLEREIYELENEINSIEA